MLDAFELMHAARKRKLPRRAQRVAAAASESSVAATAGALCSATSPISILSPDALQLQRRDALQECGLHLRGEDKLPCGSHFDGRQSQPSVRGKHGMGRVGEQQPEEWGHRLPEQVPQADDEQEVRVSGGHSLLLRIQLHGEREVLQEHSVRKRLQRCTRQDVRPRLLLLGPGQESPLLGKTPQA